jgi:hypothetical protein
MCSLRLENFWDELERRRAEGMCVVVSCVFAINLISTFISEDFYEADIYLTSIDHCFDLPLGIQDGVQGFIANFHEP